MRVTDGWMWDKRFKKNKKKKQQSGGMKAEEDDQQIFMRNKWIEN